MSQSKSIIGILISLVIAGLILLAGSHGSVIVSGLPLFLICGAIGFVLHWAVFMPSYAAQTEHYFDLTGSLSYIATVVAAVLLNPSFDIRDLIICAMIIIWAGRLGSFLFFRIKKDGQDSRFVVMKTKFTWFLMIWTIGGLWVLVTMAAGLAALTSNTTVELGLMGYVGIALWLFGFVVEVTADRQKTRFKNDPQNKGRFITTGIWSWSQHPNSNPRLQSCESLHRPPSPALRNPPGHPPPKTTFYSLFCSHRDSCAPIGVTAASTF